jgi:hypothetical protein
MLGETPSVVGAECLGLTPPHHVNAVRCIRLHMSGFAVLRVLVHVVASIHEVVVDVVGVVALTDE